MRLQLSSSLVVLVLLTMAANGAPTGFKYGLIQRSCAPLGRTSRRDYAGDAAGGVQTSSLVPECQHGRVARVAGPLWTDG